VKAVAIMQARTGSSRLPGKVLLEVAGEPMLAHQIRRLQRVEELDDIVVATTVDPADDPIAAVAEAEGARSFRGSEHDVLDRYCKAAAAAAAEVVLRVTADCPLLDPEVAALVLSALATDGALDYASNVVERTYPAGLDAEALTAETLARIFRLGRSPEAREHVTWFLLRERPDLFRIKSVTDDVDNSDLRWTVDHRRDLELVRRLYDELDLARNPRSYRDVVAYVRKRPELATLNT
jgi:spore coat polysaccharide biosynthesis protein SpsF